ncbi:MAG: hypothetical protein VW985_13860 [Gammaproteobacteria bacterium]
MQPRSPCRMVSIRYTKSMGVDVLLLSSLDYSEELTFFGERVMPLMVQAGLRAR